ncbi:ABC transporter substrate-binding protein [Hydrogenibacillus schlegelii]|nr:ABC transporter substrate-binding protein [Hydrogenibacillus schlegelii]
MMKGWAFALAVFGALALTACGAGTEQGAPSEGAAREAVTVMLDWYPNTNHLGLYWAREKGLFAAEGLDVSIVQPGESGVAQAVAAGRADFGYSYQEEVTYARASGVPVVSLGTLYQHNTSAFASLKEAGIRSVRDFEGKRYGGWGSPTEEAVLRALMTKYGADFSKVEMIVLGQADFFATIGKEADFEWIYYGWDGIEAERRGMALDLLFLKDLDPVFDYYTPVIITGEAMLEKRPETARRFMRALAKGYQAAYADPEAAAEVLLKAAPELHGELVRRSAAYLAGVDASDRAEGRPSWGHQKREVWARFADWMHASGLIEQPIDVDRAFTNDFLPSDVK